MGKLMNDKRTARLTLIFLAAVVVLLGAGMLIMSTMGSSQVSAEIATEETEGQMLIIEDPAAYAEKLYGCKVEDINDTASVVQLLETMDMEAIAGKYTVEIAPEDDIVRMTLTAEEPVKAETRRAYDANMEICAQQMLALMPEIDEVQWTYSVLSSGEKEEQVTVSIDAADATGTLGNDIRSYGRSQAALEQLAIAQTGEK